MASYHAQEYIDALKSCNSGYFDFTMLHYGLGTGDNPIFKGVFDFSLLVLGATMAGTQFILDNEADTVFSPVGGLHHGGYGHAEGFCYVNDIVDRHQAYAGTRIQENTLCRYRRAPRKRCAGRLLRHR